MNKSFTPLMLLGLTLLASSCSQSTSPTSQAAGVIHKQAVTGKFTGDKIMLISGQTSDGITNYQQQLPGKSAGVTLYVNPMLQTSGFTGGSTPAWYSSGYGDQNLNVAKSATTTSQAIAVGIWMGQAIDTDLAKAIDPSKPWDGDIQYQYLGGQPGTQMLQNLRTIITDLKNAGRPVFVRLGYEAEGPWNGYWPDAYKTIWSWFKAEVGRQGANNIALVWQVAAWCNGGVLSGGGPLSPTGNNTNDTRPVGSNLAAFYDQWWPGDANVDWTGISLFDQGTECNNGLTAVQDVVNYLKSKGKPIMISESTPRGYTLAADGQAKFEQVGKTTRSGLTGQTIWNEWYTPFFNFIEANQQDIRAVAYINDNWEAYSHWQCSLTSGGGVQGGCAEGEWGNSQLSANATVKNNWNTRISNGLYQFTAGTGTEGGGNPPGGDTQAPSTPGAVTSPSKTTTTINLTWGASTDNVSVAKYEIYLNNALAASPTTTSTTLSGLTPNTTYNIKVRALDAAGNTSPFNTPINVTTDNTTTPPPPPPPSSGGTDIGDNYTYRVQSVQSNKCMDVSGISGANGAAIHLWDCIQQNPYYNQDWKFKRVSTPEGVFYQLIAQHSQKCLDVSGVSLNNGAALHQWDCHTTPDSTSLRNQLFALQDMGGGSYRFRAKHSGKCIDIYGAGTANGTAFVQWDCHTGDNQKFRFQSVSH